MMGTLVRKYHGVGPLLIKVEGLVAQSNTGHSSKLRNYYSYWEKRVFDALLKVRAGLFPERALVPPRSAVFFPLARW